MLATLVLAGIVALPLYATVEPERRSDVAEKAFRHADLDIPVVRHTVSELDQSRVGPNPIVTLGGSGEHDRRPERYGPNPTVTPGGRWNSAQSARIRLSQSAVNHFWFTGNSVECRL